MLKPLGQGLLRMARRRDMGFSWTQVAVLVSFIASSAGRGLEAPEAAPLSEPQPQPEQDPDSDLGYKSSIYDRLDPAVYRSMTGTGDPNRMAEFPADGHTVSFANLPMSKKTVLEVNAAAPLYTLPTHEGEVQVRPRLSQISHGANGAIAKDGFVQSMSVHPSKAAHSQKLKGTVLNPAALEGGGKNGEVSSKAVDDDTIVLGARNPAARTGFFLNLIAGVRVATPFFGSGFNFCVDRFWSSFPKVGIVIPNPIAWLLPEFAETASEFATSIRLPIIGKTAPFGARIAQTSDGFVIWLPSAQPVTIPSFGFRYGVQVAQLFGIDFGFGWTQTTCAVDFVRV